MVKTGTQWNLWTGLGRVVCKSVVVRRARRERERGKEVKVNSPPSPQPNWLLLVISNNEIQQAARQFNQRKASVKFEMEWSWRNKKKMRKWILNCENTSNGMDTFGRSKASRTCSAASNKKRLCSTHENANEMNWPLQQQNAEVVLLFIIFNFRFFLHSARTNRIFNIQRPCDQWGRKRNERLQNN